MLFRLARVGVFLAVFCLLMGPTAVLMAQEKEESSPAKDLNDLVGAIQKKLMKFQNVTTTPTVKDFAEELKGFDQLLEKYKGQKTEDVARILFMKGTLYQQVFEDEETALKLFVKLKAEFPDTKFANAVEGMITFAKLKKGTLFPDFQKEDMDGNVLSVSKFRNKVVLVDFWATWCGPCVGELPNVIETYKKFHKDGFEIIGISLDKDRKKLLEFMKEQKGMSWPQFFDGKGWENELAGKYGVRSIPATFLLGPDGKIIGKGLRAKELDKAVEAAVLKMKKSGVSKSKKGPGKAVEHPKGVKVIKKKQ